MLVTEMVTAQSTTTIHKNRTSHGKHLFGMKTKIISYNHINWNLFHQYILILIHDGQG